MVFGVQCYEPKVRLHPIFPCHISTRRLYFRGVLQRKKMYISVQATSESFAADRLHCVDDSYCISGMLLCTLLTFET